MEKLCYVVWKHPDVSNEAFRDQLVADTAKKILDRGAHKLSVVCVDEISRDLEGARISHMENPIAGMISLWMDLCDDRPPIEEAIDEITQSKAGYLVVESVPLINTTHTAPMGERTPGTTLLTCLKQTPRMSYDEWLTHWHVVQRKVAVETQCTYLYTRNVIVRALTEGAPDWKGIVEEGFPTEAVLDPMLWYLAEGSEERMQENRRKMIESVMTFLDIDQIESHPTSEYILR
jgi:hypothetical protein